MMILAVYSYVCYACRIHNAITSESYLHWNHICTL